MMPPLLSALTSTPATRYRLVCRLTGHKDAIHCLTVNVRGTLLASGGAYLSLRRFTGLVPR
jgi:hypothetical protein